MPHRGFPERMQAAILKGKIEPMVGRPGDTLGEEDFAKVKAEMEAEFQREVTEEDIQAFLMYPAVFRGYMKHLNKAGPLTTYIPSPSFFYGMEVGETIEFEAPGGSLLEAEASFDGDAPKSKYTIELVRAPALEHDDMRAVEWLVNGVKHVVKMQDTPADRKKYAGPMAVAGNKSHVASSLPGIVTVMAVSEGQMVQKDDLLCTVVSMKMEVMVRAPEDCMVEQVCVGKETEVVEGALLVKLKL